MNIYLTGHNETYAVRDILRLFLPDEPIEFAAAPPEGGDYALVSHTETDGRHVFSASVSYQGRMGVCRESQSAFDKTCLKRCLLRAFMQIFPVTPPWGALTGIRPTKIARALLEAGHTKGSAEKLLKSQYLLNDKKAALTVQTAMRERDVISGRYKNAVSLYIGIPFCPTRCLYCSFISQSIEFSKQLVEPYLLALAYEMEQSAKLLSKLGYLVETVYIGGGTPTALSAPQLDFLLNTLKTAFDLSAIREFSVEAGRPDTITSEKLDVLKRHGVDRISINPQTMNEKTLRLIGRSHTPDDVANAYLLARKKGFSHINMDLISGLPGETAEDFLHTLNRTAAFFPESVTVHALCVKHGSYLAQKYPRQDITANQAANTMMDLAVSHLAAQNLHPYYLYRQKNAAGNLENIGFCKIGHECRYNVYIMQEVQSVLALGAGGSSKRVAGQRIDRAFNVKEVSAYIERIKEMVNRKETLFMG